MRAVIANRSKNGAAIRFSSDGDTDSHAGETTGSE